MREREGLVARIRQIRRASAVAATPPPSATPDLDASRVQALEVRIDRLEQLVEALQDSVYRESERHGKRLAELDARIQPAALGAALDRDARERGL